MSFQINGNFPPRNLVEQAIKPSATSKTKSVPKRDAQSTGRSQFITVVSTNPVFRGKPLSRPRLVTRRDVPPYPHGSRFVIVSPYKPVNAEKALFRPLQANRHSKRDVPQFSHGSRFVIVSPYKPVHKGKALFMPQPRLVTSK
jgi:hypothetical protein